MGGEGGALNGVQDGEARPVAADGQQGGFSQPVARIEGLGFSPYLLQFARLLRTFPFSQVMGPAVGETFFRGLLGTTPLLLGKSVLTYLMFLALNFNPLGFALGVYGWWTGFRAFPSLWRMAVACYAVYTLFGLLYRVSDQFAFFQASHVFWALAMRMGAARLLNALSERRRRWLIGGLGVSVLAMPLLYGTLPGLLRATGATDAAFGIPQIGTGVRDGLAFYINPNKRSDNTSEQFGRDTLAALPPNAVILAEWYTDTDEYFVFRYFTAVEHLRPDVEIVGWPLEDPFRFDSTLAVNLVEDSLEAGRPVYLASLSEEYYGVERLEEKYRIVEEDNLYRVLSASAGH